MTFFLFFLISFLRCEVYCNWVNRRGGASPELWCREGGEWYESKSQLLIHTCGRGVGQEKQRQGRAVWLVGAGCSGSPMLLSSGVMLDVILNLIPKVLLRTEKVKRRKELDGKTRSKNVAVLLFPHLKPKMAKKHKHRSN